jgi:putative membrane-bound dehydrogenase-like protein
MKPNAFRLLALAAISVATSVQLLAQERTPRSTALSPAESLACIELAEGFEIKVIAHEPQVIDPVDAAFDDQGRLWVVEMRDYPYPTSESPSGCVRILSDEDLDGRFEKSVVFAERLDMPTGLALWKDGAVVTLAGQVVWFRDTDGDLKSDTQQVWIEGFAKENEQLRANHPRLGPDGWWYIASGLRGGNVMAGPDFRNPDDKPLALGSRDVRFNPETKQLDAITGPAQFGLCFDSVGNRIFCSNRNPAVMVRFEQEDLIGNPLAGLIPSVVDLIPAGEQSKVFPLVNAWTTSNLHSGQFTAACGVFYHEFAGENSRQVPDDFHEAVRLFACEPTGSLVHSTVFHGALTNPLNQNVGRSGRTLEHGEWLASRDEWFRPVNIAHSPDGGILIVDMHRAVIEHPAWVPDELKKRPDERWGNNCGRIFQVAWKNYGAVDVIPDLHSKPLRDRESSQLVAYLSSKNVWIRETSRRLLIERNASEQFEGVLKIVNDQRLGTASRVTALQLASVLAHETEQTRQLSELVSHLLDQSDVPLFTIALYRIATSQFATDATIVEKITNTTSENGGISATIECLRCLAATKARPQVSEAALVERVQSLLPVVAASGASLLDELLVHFAAAFKERPEIVLTTLLNSIEDSPDSFSNNETYPVAIGRLINVVLDRPLESAPGILDHARRLLASEHKDKRRAALAVLAEITKRGSKSALDLDLASSELWDNISGLAVSESEEPSLRVRAIAMLANSTRASDLELLPKFAHSNDLQFKTAALRAWASTSDTACDALLLSELASSSPQLQQVLLDLIGQKPERLAGLAEQLATGEITAQRIGSNELKKLVSRAKGDTQAKLNAALESIVNSDRAKVLANYQACLTMPADALRGKQIFAKHCANCHRVADVGVQVGPDISDSRTQQPAQILTNILDPNRAIDNNYFRFVALTADDQVIEGMIAEETSDAIVLRGQYNARSTLKRADLQELRATGVSLMPEGLEVQIDPQAMADLISFIKNWRYLDGSIPK